MNPSPEAVAAIRARVADWSPTDAEVASALNAPTVDNPTPAATVPIPFLTRDLMGTLDQPALAKIMALPSLARLLEDIERGEPGRLDNWIALLTAGGAISQAQAGVISGVVHATGPDPSWPSLISWAQASLGRPVDVDDVAAARASGG
jgi:hypothetical protein